MAFTNGVPIPRELYQKFRSRMKELDLPNASQKIQILEKENPELKISTVRHIAFVCDGSSDKMFDMFMDGKIGMRVITVLAQSKMDVTTREFLTEEAAREKWSEKTIAYIKSYLKGGYSMAEAIGKATGKIPLEPKYRTRSGAVEKSFDGLLDEIMKLGTMYRMKIELLKDILPATTLDRGKAHYEVFHKAYLMRHVISEMYDYVDRKVKVYLDEIQEFLRTESALKKGDIYDSGSGACEGSEDERAGGEAVDGFGGAVQDTAQPL